jgi:hypothetical protein
MRSPRWLSARSGETEEKRRGVMQANMNDRPLAGWTTTIACWIAGTTLLLGGAGALIASYFQLWSHLAPPPDSGIDPSQLGPEDTNPYVPWESWRFSHEFLLGLPLAMVVIALLVWLAPWRAAHLALGALSLLAGCFSLLMLFGVPFIWAAGDSAFHVEYDPGFYLGLVGYFGLVVGTALLFMFPMGGRRVAHRHPT